MEDSVELVIVVGGEGAAEGESGGEGQEAGVTMEEDQGMTLLEYLLGQEGAASACGKILQHPDSILLQRYRCPTRGQQYYRLAPLMPDHKLLNRSFVLSQQLYLLCCHPIPLYKIGLPVGGFCFGSTRDHLGKQLLILVHRWVYKRISCDYAILAHIRRCIGKSLILLKYPQFSHVLQTISKSQMLFKTLLVATLLLLSACHTEEDNVLVLTDADFPNVFNQFNFLLVEFYAPWCGHCKSLAPIYVEVATALKEQGSNIRLAKVDATQNEASAQQYDVQGYPTLFFFINGQKINYGGPRTKEGMLAWLEKKTRDPIALLTLEEYQRITSEPSEIISIIYHGDLAASADAEALKKLAVADQYNTFYYGVDLGHPAGTVEIVRYFDAPATYPSVDEGLKNWIAKNERPLVVVFDERAIEQIFEQQKRAIVLFNSESSKQLLNVFTSAAKEYSGEPLIFTEVNAQNEHLDNFAIYLKIDRRVHSVVLINVEVQEKYVFEKELTKENLLEFLGNFDQYRYGLNQEVKADGEAEAEAEDAEVAQHTEEAEATEEGEVTEEQAAATEEL